MRKIEMVDLRRQYLEIRDEINLEIEKVLDSSAFIRGEKVAEFQKDLQNFLGVKNVILVGNGTDALQIALMTLDLKRGDEVILPAFTFVSALEVVALLGLKPVLVDVNWHDFNISVEAIEKAISPKTRAIIPVHLFGQNADMERILELARKHNLFVVEDACQSLSSEIIFNNSKNFNKKMSGCAGTIGCTSFFPSKNLGCFGDGGALFTDDDELAQKAQAIANHGMRTRYQHDFIGVNSRLDTLQAAILDVKLKNFNRYITARQTAAAFYDAAFEANKALEIPMKSSFSTHVFHQYTLKVINKNRDELRAKLAEKGIPTMVYYPKPLHLQRAYAFLDYKEGAFATAEKLSQTVLSLPMHTELDEEQLAFIAENVNKFTK